MKKHIFVITLTIFMMEISSLSAIYYFKKDEIEDFIHKNTYKTVRLGDRVSLYYKKISYVPAYLYVQLLNDILHDDEEIYGFIPCAYPYERGEIQFNAGEDALEYLRICAKNHNIQ